MPPIRQDQTLLRLIRDVNEIRSVLRRVTVNLPLFDIANENTPAQITADQNNYVPGNYDILRLESDQAGRTITGFRGGIKGRSLRLFNVGNHELFIAHQSGSSDAENRIISPTGFDMVLNSGGEIALYYDITVDRWISTYNSNADRISADLRITGNKSVSNASYYYIAWDSAITDTGNFWDAGSPTLITFPETGWYTHGVVTLWEPNGTNFRETIVSDPLGTAVRVWDSRTAVTAGQTVVTLRDFEYYEKGDQIRIGVWQNSGGNLNLEYERMPGSGSNLKTRWVVVKM